VPPSHLVPLLSPSVAAAKKKKKRRDRAALLAESSPATQDAVNLYERSRSPRSRSRGRSVPTNHDNSVYHEPTQEAVVQQMTQSRPVSRGNRSDAWLPGSVDFFCCFSRVEFCQFCLLCIIMSHNSLSTCCRCCCVVVRDRIDPCSGSESEADSPKSVPSRSNGNRKPI